MTTEEIAAANEARIQFILQHGVPVPRDQMYLTSLLEFLLLGELEEAKAYHERRIAPILDRSIGGIQHLQAQAQSQQARKTLLEGVR